MTSSKASLSPMALSFWTSQCSRTSLARCLSPSRLETWLCSSTSVRLAKAVLVTEHNRRVELISRSGGGGGPRRLLSPLDADELIDAEEPFSCRSLAIEPFGSKSIERREDECSVSTSNDGSINIFCLLAGNISSRSTGTPSETRKRRRIRERTQFGGCSGGGATS